MHPKVYALAAVMITKYAAFNINDLENLIGGLIMGLIEKDDLSLIKACLKDAQAIDEKLTEAVTDFLKKDITDIIAGVEVVGEVLVELPKDLSECQGMKDDVTRIEKWAAIFSQPTVLLPTISKNLLFHYAQVMKDASNIESDIAADKMYDAGENIADLLITAVGKVKAVEDVDDITYTQW